MEQEQKTRELKKNVKIRYEETKAVYASQFVVNTTAEEVIINFSSGYLMDPASGDTLLPVHSRIALSIPAAARLSNVIAHVLRPKDNAGGIGKSQDLPGQGASDSMES